MVQTRRQRNMTARHNNLRVASEESSTYNDARTMDYVRIRTAHILDIQHTVCVSIMHA